MTTETKAKVEVDVKPRGIASAICYAPFDESKEAFEEKGFRVISLAENARLRIQEGADSYVSRNGNYTREGIVYIPKKGNFLTLNSPVLYEAEKATQAHREGREFYPTEEAIEKALEDSVQFPDKNIEIPTKRFSDEELTVWTFGGEEVARQYGEFLKQAGIKEMPVWVVGKDYVNDKNKPFVRQMWFRCLGGRSGLGGYGRVLYCGRVRGVCEDAEGVAKNLESFTLEQLQRALKTANLLGIEAILLESLRK